MKRQFGLLLASVLLVFALTACGGDDKDTSHDSGDQNTAGDSLEDAGDAIQDAGDDILDAGEDILDPNDKDHADSGRDPADRHRGGCRHQAERPDRRELRADASERPGPRHGRLSEGRRKRRQSRRPVRRRCGISRQAGSFSMRRAAAEAAALPVFPVCTGMALAFSAEHGTMGSTGNTSAPAPSPDVRAPCPQAALHSRQRPRKGGP